MCKTYVSSKQVSEKERSGYLPKECGRLEADRLQTLWEQEQLRDESLRRFRQSADGSPGRAEVRRQRNTMPHWPKRTQVSHLRAEARGTGTCLPGSYSGWWGCRHSAVPAPLPIRQHAHTHQVIPGVRQIFHNFPFSFKSKLKINVPSVLRCISLCNLPTFLMLPFPEHGRGKEERDE